MENKPANSNEQLYFKYFFWFGSITAIALSMFSLYTGIFGVLSAWLQRCIHICLVLIITFLIPQNKNEKRYDWVAIVGTFITLFIFGYCLLFYEDITVKRSGSPNTLDMIVAALFVLMIVIACWRKLGKAITFVVVGFGVYMYIGRFLPGVFSTPAFSAKVIVNTVFNTTLGIFNTPLGVSATYIVIFILFGGFLLHTNAGDAFMVCLCYYREY